MPTLVAGVAFIDKDGKVLTISNHHGSHTFIGGKIEGKEKPIDALMRECREELPGANITALSYYHSFAGKNRRDEDVEIYIFIGEVEGDLTPGSELTEHEVNWVGFDEFEGSQVMKEIMTSLKNDGYIT